MTNIREHLGHIIQHAQAAQRRDDDTERRLTRIKAFVTSPDRLTEWDGWRKYIADGGRGSWPRDAYECILDWIAEECGEASTIPRVTATAIAAILSQEGGNPLHLAYSEQWRIPAVAEKIARLFAARVPETQPETSALSSTEQRVMRGALRRSVDIVSPPAQGEPSEDDLREMAAQLDAATYASTEETARQTVANASGVWRHGWRRREAIAAFATAGRLRPSLPPDVAGLVREARELEANIRYPSGVPVYGPLTTEEARAVNSALALIRRLAALGENANG